jgi:hypothetical protein
MLNRRSNKITKTFQRKACYRFRCPAIDTHKIQNIRKASGIFINSAVDDRDKMKKKKVVYFNVER